MRINKFLASCGVASRRNSEQFVLEGRVKVNGKVITVLSTEINVDNDTVLLDGKAVSLPKKHIYLMMNKPKGYICATEDSKHKVVLELLEGYNVKDLIIVGRLDIDTEGLLIITNDGNNITMAIWLLLILKN